MTGEDCVVDFVRQYGIENTFKAALDRHAPIDDFSVDELKGGLPAGPHGTDIHGDSAGLAPVGHGFFQPVDGQRFALVFGGESNLSGDISVFGDDDEVCSFKAFYGERAGAGCNP